MKEILLSNGKVCLVDDLDFDFLNQFNWHHGNTGYAVTNICAGGTNFTTRMHRIIMAAPAGLEVDHRNRNTLDNRRANLRFCQRGENNHNSESRLRLKRKGKFTSKYFGVKKNTYGSFSARITHNKKPVNLGTFKTEIEAHKAVVAGSLRLYGEFSPYFMKCKYDH